MKPGQQPKTLQDYRDLTKVLKLKIMKQSKIIQGLQSKCQKYQSDINNATFKITEQQQQRLMGTKGFDEVGEVQENELSTLKGKSKVMIKFLRGTKFFGITPQSIYRIADFNSTNCIQSDYFRSILSKMSLNLSPKQISCLIFIFDEHYSGYITKDDYYNSLHAYQIGLQENCLPYTQQCLLRLCSLFHTEKIDLNKFYDQMKTNANKTNGQVDLIVFQQHVKTYFNNKLQEREIIGAFNQINLQKQQSIDKRNFLYGVNSFINRLLIDSSSKLENSSQYPNSSNLKNSRSQLRGPNKTSGSLSVANNNISSTFKQIKQQAILNDSCFQIEKILQSHNCKFQELIHVLIQSPFKKRMSLHQFNRLAIKASKQLKNQQISEIFKTIDFNHQGSIHIIDLINFTLTYYKNVHYVFILLGKSFQVLSTTPEEFWFYQQFQDLTRVISKPKFIQVMAKSFNTKEPQNWDLMWNYFDKGKGVVSLQAFVDVWKKYQVQ